MRKRKKTAPDPESKPELDPNPDLWDCRDKLFAACMELRTGLNQIMGGIANISPADEVFEYHHTLVSITGRLKWLMRASTKVVHWLNELDQAVSRLKV
jgi:hypothetical protein